MRALVRLSPEITTKAPKTRNRFIRTLIANLGAAAEANGYGLRVERDHSRIYLEFDRPEVLAVVRRVCGVLSVSPCRIEPYRDFDALLDESQALMAPRVAGKTFAVRARVRDRSTGLHSQRINEHHCARLMNVGRVDLTSPEVTVRLEIRDGRIVYYVDQLAGEGGIPVGEGGTAVVLLSAGFDSAVAAQLMLRRGIRLEFVTCRLGGPSHEREVLAVANRLAEQWMPGLRTRLWVIPFEGAVEELRAKVFERYRQLVLKRLMYRVAEEVAGRIRGDAIVTGECLGQVSSQTLKNLRAISMRTTMPVMRPLLTYSKNEIIERAKHVGTQHLSSGVPEYCALGTKPATGARPRDVHEQEDRVTFDASQAVDIAIVRTLPHLEEAASDDITADPRASDGVIFDLRSPPERKLRPLAGAKAIEPLELLRQPESLATDTRYFVVCDSGARSDWFVRELRRLGFTAHRWENWRESGVEEFGS